MWSVFGKLGRLVPCESRFGSFINELTHYDPDLGRRIQMSSAIKSRAMNSLKFFWSLSADTGWLGNTATQEIVRIQLAKKRSTSR